MEDLNLDLMMETLGLREVIMGVIVLVFLYMLWLLVRMVRLSMGSKSDKIDDLGRAAPVLETKPVGESSVWTTTPEPSLKSLVNSLFGTEEPDPKVALDRERRAALYAEVGSNLRMRGGVASSAGTSRPTGKPAAEAGSNAGGDEPERAGSTVPPKLSPLKDPRVQSMAKELESMRNEVKELRKHLSSMQNQWHTEITQVQISQSTAPIYNDAMHLASQGLDAATIADRCGIPLGEATLVVALVGKQQRRA